jgi:repressor LexA
MNQDKEREINQLIARRLRHYLDYLGKSQQDLANYMGVSHTTVSNWCAGIKLPRMDKFDRICEFLNCTRSDLMEDKPITDSQSFDNLYSIEKKSFPLLGEIACGEPIMADEEFELYVKAGTDVQADFCLRCKGDSMTGARIQDGDIVFIRKQPMVENGEIAAVIIDDEATLKRVYYDDKNSKIVLQAENPHYAPLVYVNDELNQVRILGKAVAFQSDVK